MFNDNPNWTKVNAEKNGITCQCGLRECWNPNVGIQRICIAHKIILRDQVQNSCRYIEIQGMRVPISPDGIPMVNLAQPINKTEHEQDRRNAFSEKGRVYDTFDVKIEDEVEDEVENYKPAFTGLMIFGLFSSSLPKIAGNRYKPGAWIPYKDEEAGLLEIPKNIDDCV